STRNYWRRCAPGSLANGGASGRPECALRGRRQHREPAGTSETASPTWRRRVTFQPNMNPHDDIVWGPSGRASDVPIAADGPPLAPVPGSPMVEFALDYARRGWPVFPSSPRDKAPLVGGGFNSATTDPETVRQWWMTWPHAMIGVPTGSRSGV